MANEKKITPVFKLHLKFALNVIKVTIIFFSL